MKDKFIRMNIKQKVGIKLRQTSIDIFSNQILLELNYCLFWFIQTKMTMLKKNKLKLKDITYQKELSKTIKSLSMEKPFMTNQLIVISKDMKK